MNAKKFASTCRNLKFHQKTIYTELKNPLLQHNLFCSVKNNFKIKKISLN